MLDSAANFIQLTVSTGYGSTDTTIVLSSGGASLPAAPFNLVWWNSTDYPNPANDPNVEIVRVTNVSGNTLTVTRGQETAYGAPAASTKNAIGKTYLMLNGITALMIANIGSKLQQPWKLVTVSGVIDGVNAVFTLNGAITPYDANSMQLSLAQQGQVQGVHYALSGTTITYTSPPDKSLAGQPHYAQYQ